MSWTYRLHVLEQAGKFGNSGNNTFGLIKAMVMDEEKHSFLDKDQDITRGQKHEKLHDHFVGGDWVWIWVQIGRLQSSSAKNP